MTADEFLEKWTEYKILHEDTQKQMKADLEEMIQEAKNDVMDIPVKSIRAKEDGL